jgi:hypothetical protein
MSERQFNCHTLFIDSPSYDPKFCPVSGSVKARYNGVYFIIRVRGASVYADIRSPEQDLKLNLEMEEAGSTSWEELVQEVLSSIIYKLTTTANNQKIYQEERGTFCAH